MAGRQGNTNACTHGLRMVVNGLPPGCRRLEGTRRQLRRMLEQAVADVHGEVGIVHAATIQSIIRWETHAALCARWLRHALEKGEPLTHADKLAYSREVARASAERDKAMRSLGIDKQGHQNVWATLYAQPALSSPDAPDAPDAKPGPSEATSQEAGAA